MPFISQREVERIKENYPVGTKIRMHYMNDPFFPIPKNMVGVITSVDDAGQLHMHWENGSSLAVIPGEDHFTVISRPD